MGKSSVNCESSAPRPILDPIGLGVGRLDMYFRSGSQGKPFTDSAKQMIGASAGRVSIR